MRSRYVLGGFGPEKVAGPTLERLSLLHVCKLAPEHSSPEESHPLPQAWHDDQLRNFVWGKQRDPYWYLRDPRWLSARPKHLGWNPLADLHYLFPNLHQLEISLAQLTGPMLLRLLFQTRLSLLIVVQTDLSPRLTTYDPYEAAPPRVHYVDTLQNLDEAAEAPDPDRFRDNASIDWGADVPTSESFPHRIYTLDWRPIDPEFWRQARALRSDLRVEIKFRFLRPSTQLRSFALPALPAPVTSVVCIFGGSDQVSSYWLFERCLATLSRYSTTLTSLVDLEALEAKERDEASRPSSLTLARFRTRRQITPTKDIMPKPLDEQLLKLLTSCPYVSSLSLGGRLLNIHLTTLGQICRLLVGASRQTPPPLAPPQVVRRRRPSLCVDCASVRLSGELPDSTSARDSSIFTQLMQDCRGNEASPAAKARAAECFISASLGVPRWRFMQSTEYRHYVNAL
ncbi:unnamed protein product [Schistocephalus solidus]|uniref:Protein SERAC1 n=1 Tax=Schistocephalus solidus TaxID=70667 RepID=A0A183SRB6_SCHSO|nr:unnamed protein product [Schistocephalus solidus]